MRHSDHISNGSRTCKASRLDSIHHGQYRYVLISQTKLEQDFIIDGYIILLQLLQLMETLKLSLLFYFSYLALLMVIGCVLMLQFFLIKWWSVRRISIWF